MSIVTIRPDSTCLRCSRASDRKARALVMATSCARLSGSLQQVAVHALSTEQRYHCPPQTGGQSKTTSDDDPPHLAGCCRRLAHVYTLQLAPPPPLTPPPKPHTHTHTRYTHNQATTPRVVDQQRQVVNQDGGGRAGAQVQAGPKVLELVQVTDIPAGTAQRSTA